MFTTVKNKTKSILTRINCKKFVSRNIFIYNYFRLYQYSSSLDIFCIFIGITCSIINGTLFPVLMISFGSCMGAIVDYSSSLNNETISEQKRSWFLNNMNYQFKLFVYESIVVGFLNILTGYLSFILLNYSASRQVFKLRKKFYETLLYKNITWFDIHPPGDISTVLTHNFIQIEDGIGGKVAILVYFIAAVVSGSILSIMQGWKVGLASLVSMPSFIIVSVITFMMSLKSAQDERKYVEAAGSIAEEVLSSIKTVVAFNGQDKEKMRYEENLRKVRNINLKRGVLNAIAKAVYFFGGYCGFGFMFWIGTKLVVENAHLSINKEIYTPATLLTVFFMLLSTFCCLEFIMPSFEIFADAVSASEEIFFVLNSNSSKKEIDNDGIVLNGFNNNIHFDKVSFNYPARPDVKVLEDFTFKITKGEIVALVGSSGCGKTTCIQLIQKLYEPSKGKITIDNIDLKTINNEWLNQIVGIVGQEPVLFATTIYTNIKLGKLNATKEEIEEAAKKAKIHDFIMSLPKGYNTLLGEGGTRISGGQKQKIAIARALVKKPGILLLDEATSALDNTSEAEVQEALDSVSKNCTTIIVAHRLSTIKKATRIIFIKEGKVVEKGNHSYLMDRKGEYYNLFKSQKLNEIKNTNNVLDTNTISSGSLENTEIIRNYFKSVDENKVKTKEGKIKNKIVLLKIMNLIASNWYHYFLGIFSSIISGITIPSYGLVLSVIIHIFSTASGEELLTDMNKPCLYFCIFGIIFGISSFLQIYSLQKAGEDLSFKVKYECFQSMLNQEMAWFDKKEHGVGALCARLSGDASAISSILGTELGIVIQSISLLFFTFLFSFCIEWRVALILAFFCIIIFIVAYVEQKLNQNESVKKTRMLEASVMLVVESINNVKTVASLGCQKDFLDKFTKELVLYQKMSIKKSHIRGFFYGLLYSGIVLVYPIGMWYGIKLIREENIQYGKIFLVCEIMIFGLWNAGNMLAMVPNISNGITAASRIISLLERKPRIGNDSEETINKPWDNGYVDYSKIYFAYHTRPYSIILNQFSIHIPKGKTVALVGSSGSGKSTVLQLLQRFYDPCSGDIVLNNDNINKIDLKALRSQLGMVSQEPHLFNKTIAENIAYGNNSADVEMDEVIKAARAANIHNFIVGLPQGYDTKIGKRGSQLSGGQKQRIAIARSLIKDPKILLLDEATSALDNTSEKIVQESLDNARKGRTCIIVAHRLTTIQNADIICVLNSGFIIEVGTHEELVRKGGLYYTLYNLQRSL